MIFARYSDLFAHCLPVFWPWLWWQLARLVALKQADGRERLIAVHWYGRVEVLGIGDPPAPARLFRPLEKILSAFAWDAALQGVPQDAANDRLDAGNLAMRHAGIIADNDCLGDLRLVPP